MQELRSTEVLEQEIQSEARKRVENILQKAESDCNEIINSVDEKVKEALEQKKIFYAKKLEKLERDLDASIPLEKQRFEVSFIQDTFISRINDYLKGLSEEKRIQLVLKNLDSSYINQQNLKVSAFVYGFSTSAVKNALSKVLGKNLSAVEKTEFGKLSLEDEIGLTLKEGIIIISEDNNYKCRLTLSEVINHFLDKYRKELYNALFVEEN